MSVNFEEENFEDNDLSREDLFFTIAKTSTQALAREISLRKELEEKARGLDQERKCLDLKLQKRDHDFEKLRDGYVRQVKEIEGLKCKLDSIGDKEHQSRKIISPFFTFGQELIFGNGIKFTVNYIQRTPYDTFEYSENGDDYYFQDSVECLPIEEIK